jgi:hypothetical protein
LPRQTLNLDIQRTGSRNGYALADFSWGVSMIRRRSILLGTSAAGLCGISSPLFAQNRVKSGTVEIEQVQIAFIGSGNVGGGTLYYEGRSYRFSIGGLGIGGIGISKMEATGNVYNLRRLSEFPGAYGQARSGIAVGNEGSGQLWLENPNGVVIELRAKRTGLALSLGADAVYIDFK